MGRTFWAVCLSVCSITKKRMIQSVQTWYREWPWDILEVTCFWDWKVKVIDSISGFFTIMTIMPMLMQISWQQQYGMGLYSVSAFSLLCIYVYTSISIRTIGWFWEFKVIIVDNWHCSGNPGCQAAPPSECYCSIGVSGSHLQHCCNSR